MSNVYELAADRLFGNNGMPQRGVPTPIGAPAPAAPPERNRYEAAFEDMNREREADQRRVLRAAVEQNPDQAAEAAKLAPKYQVPQDVLYRNLADVKLQEVVTQASTTLQASPLLAQRMRERPELAAQAHDDIGPLTEIARVVGNLGRGGLALVGTAGYALPEVLLKAVAVPIGDVLSGQSSTIPGVRLLPANPFRAIVGELETLRKGQQAIIDEATRPLRESGSSTLQGVGSGLMSVTANLPALVMSVTTRNPAPALASAGLVAGGNSVAEALDKGLDPNRALLYGALDAGIEVAMERIPLSRLLGDLNQGTGFARLLGNQLLREIPTEQATTLLQDLNEWATLNPGKTAREFLAERPDAAYQTLIATVVGTGVQTGAVYGVQRAAERFGNAEREREDQEKIKALLQAAQTSLLRERNPEEFRQTLQALAVREDGTEPSVYIAGDVLEQLPLELLMQLPEAVWSDISAAAATGDRVAIPVSSVATLAPGTPLEQIVAEHAVLNPFDRSPAEAKEEQGQAAVFAQQEIDRVVAQAESQERTRQEIDEVRAELQQQIVAAGRYSPAASEGMATWAAAFYATMGARTGMTARQFYERYPLRVLGTPPAGQGRVLNATRPGRLDNIEAFHFSPADRVSVSTAMFGTGLQGNNRGQYATAEDRRLRQRAYFYVDKGTGINPEAGVGGRGHRASLDNIYDSDADPLRLKAGRDQLAFESAVLDAGFDGYLTRMEGTQSGQVIVLGARSIPVEQLGSLGRTQGRVVPPAGGREARGRDLIVDALRARKDLPGGELTLQRWSEVLERLAPAEHAALRGAGVFDGDGRFYKNGLVRRFESMTPAPAYEQRAEGDTRYRNMAIDLLAKLKPPRRSAVALMRGEVKTPKFNTLFEISRWFTERNRRGMEDMTDPATQRRLLDSLYADTLMALTDAGSAVGWYDAKVKAALDIMAEVHPEIATDEKARFEFITILALTSNQTKVNENFELADALYTQWKTTGVWPTDVGAVMDTRAKTEMSKSMTKVRDMIERHGWEVVRAFMTTKAKVRDIEAFTGYTLTGENKDSLVYGATFLGPKLGAFFNNLYGNFDTVTMDRWFMRTINRARGSMLELPTNMGEMFEKLRRQIEAGVDTLGFSAADMIEEINAYTVIPPEAQADVLELLDLMPTVRAYAKARHAVFSRGREVDGKQRSYVDRTSENQLAKNLDLAFHLDAQTPRSGTDRELMRSLVLRLQQRLKSDGIDMVVADIQAALWYYEKDLVDRLKGKAKTALFDTETQEAEDYETAARRVLAARRGEPAGGAGRPAARLRAGAGRAAVENRVDSTGDLFAQRADTVSAADFTPERVAGILGRSGWSILTAENPMGVQATPEANVAAMERLKAELDAVGIEYLEAVGSYGQRENSLVLLGVSEQQALEIGRRYQQDSVLTRRGLVYGDGRVTPTTGQVDVFTEAPADFFTEIPSTGARFAIGLDFDATSEPPSPDSVQQGPRGTFNPATLEIVLNPNANLSTWFHETGHFFLEVMADVASQPNAPTQITEDMGAVLRWFGVSDLAAWNAMTLDEKRQYHERWAESTEQYVMEGKAPSKELAPLLRRFSVWLKSVYKSIQQFLASKPDAERMPLNDDIRRVMDRMLATDEQIAAAEEVAGLQPHEEATAVAIERLQKRSMASLKWAVRARDEVIRKLQDQAKELRKEIIARVTEEVDATPEMRALRALDALTVDTEQQGRLDAWRTQRDAAEAAAKDAIQAQYIATEEAKGEALTGLKKGQFLTRVRREIGAKVELEMVKWDRANPKPLRQANPDDADMATIADSFGFPSVEAMLTAIQDFGSRRDAIDTIAEQRMLEEHGDLTDERAIADAANEAVHNEARARALAAELRSQREALNVRTPTGEVNARGAQVTTNAIVEAAKRFAAGVVERTALRDIKAAVWKHTAAERRAATRWLKATSAGQTAEAIQAKQDQLLHHMAAKALIEAQAEGRQIRAFFARVVKGKDETVVEKGRDADLVNAARAVLAAYGIETPASKGAQSYLNAIAQNDPETYNAIAPMVAAATENAQPVDSLTFGELQALHEAVEALWYLAKRNRKMEVAGNLMDIDDAADEMYARLEAVGIPATAPGAAGALTKAEERGRMLQYAGALLRRVEQWAESLDGKYGGPFLRLLFQPVKDAADRYRHERVVYRRKFKELVDAVAPTFVRGEIAAPELGYTFGRGHNGGGHAELLHALLHTGNSSNKRKLLLGRGWATENPDGTLDTSRWDAFISRMHDTGVLRREHYQFAQGVWDLMEQTKPGAQKAHRDAFGYYFSEVTAEAFDTPFGTFRGGYVPAQADARLVPDAEQRELLEAENANMVMAFPSTARGFTKSRVDYNKPLVLDLRTLPQHLDKVLLFTHMENPVRAAARLLRRPKVQQPLNLVQPAAISGMLRPWLNRAARQLVETPIVGDGRISRMLTTARTRAGMALMFANVSNTLQQITGVSSLLVKVRPALVGQAMASYLRSPRQFVAAVQGLSPYMADRGSQEVAAMNGQIEEMLINPSLLARAQDWTLRHAYFMQVAVDNVLSPIAWTGAYNQALQEGMTEADAVRFADGVVRQTQTSTLPEDISRIESGPAYARIFTQFFNYFSMLYNTNATALQQVVRDSGVRKGAGRIAFIVMAGLLVPLWVAEGIAVAMRGGPEDDDDDGYLDDWVASVLGMGTIKGLLASVPVVGQFGVAGINRLNDQPADDRVSLSPVVSLLEAGVGAPVSVYEALAEDGSARKATRDLASLLTMLTGLPFVALARPLGYTAGVAAGEIEPTSGADAARGLITGTPSPESR